MSGSAAVARFLIVAALAAAAAFAFVLAWRAAPQDLPWKRLDLGEPIGAFTGRKLTALHGSASVCHAVLARAGIRYTALAPLSEGRCGYSDAVRMRPALPLAIDYRPQELATSCSVAASLAAWEWEVVQPAALRHFGSPVASIDHFGSYSCRRMYGRAGAGWSEHASANAVDIAGFRLASGARISVMRDWRGSGANAAFLRAVRDGACRLFATTLSPDYNAAHADHLHLDQADRGAAGWRACR